jgi:hypothetical protein
VSVQVDLDTIRDDEQRVAWAREVGLQMHVGIDLIAARQLGINDVNGDRPLLSERAELGRRDLVHGAACSQDDRDGKTHEG